MAIKRYTADADTTITNAFKVEQFLMHDAHTSGATATFKAYYMIIKIATVAVIAAVLLALAPAQPALAKVKVMTITRTLPADGTDVAFTLKGTQNMILYEVMVDTNPTRDDGLCTPSGVPCLHCDFRVKRLTIAGSAFKPSGSEGDNDFGKYDHIALRPIVAKYYSDTHMPVKANKKVVLTLDTQNGNNDVKVKLTFGFEGGGTVKLTAAQVP